MGAPVHVWTRRPRLGGSATILVILVVVVAVTAAVAGWTGRHQRIHPAPAPWDLADAARRQVPVLTAQGAVAITALVLLVTFSSKNAVATRSFDTVVVMFLVAFLWFVGVAIEFVYLQPESGQDGGVTARFLFVLAGIQHYRTLFLSWLALKPLVDTFNLSEPATILAWLLGFGALAGWLLMASVAYQAGILRVREAFLIPPAGIALALLLGLGLRRLSPSPGFQDALELTLAIFALNAITFGVQALAPAIRRATPGMLSELRARLYVLADMQATVVVLALLWLTLLRPL